MDRRRQDAKAPTRLAAKTSRATTPPTTLGRHNPRLARLRRLCRGEDAELTVADGLRLVADLAAAGVALEELYVADDMLATVESDAAVIARAGPAVFVASHTALSELAPTRHSQGVLAVVRRPCCRLPGEGVVLYLDRIQDPGNVGAVIRCAAALGGSGVACSPGCADPFSPRAIRGSAGSALLLPVVTNADFAPIAERARQAGGEAAAAIAGDATPLSSWRPRLPLVVALGNEGEGLAAEVLRGCDSRVSIPLSSGVESLNIAVAAGIVLAGVRGLLPHLY